MLTWPAVREVGWITEGGFELWWLTAMSYVTTRNAFRWIHWKSTHTEEQHRCLARWRRKSFIQPQWRSDTICQRDGGGTAALQIHLSQVTFPHSGAAEATLKCAFEESCKTRQFDSSESTLLISVTTFCYNIAVVFPTGDSSVAANQRAGWFTHMSCLSTCGHHSSHVQRGAADCLVPEGFTDGSLWTQHMSLKTKTKFGEQELRGAAGQQESVPAGWRVRLTTGMSEKTEDRERVRQTQKHCHSNNYFLK